MKQLLQRVFAMIFQEIIFFYLHFFDLEMLENLVNFAIVDSVFSHVTDEEVSPVDSVQIRKDSQPEVWEGKCGVTFSGPHRLWDRMT